MGDSQMITEDPGAHVARLARLALDAGEKRRLTEELNAILGYMEQLNEVSTENVEPTAHVLDLVNVFRTDETDRTLAGDTPLSNAPETEQRFFVVPRIVE